MTNTFRKSEEPKPSDRRVMKPVIEKRRRERINSSLRELKIILEAVLHGQIPRDSKMEKADILELTVNHLRLSQRHHLQTMAAYDPSVMDKYRTGFSECASEISRFLTASDGVSDELRGRVLNHLSSHASTMRPHQQYACQSIRTPVDWQQGATPPHVFATGLINGGCRQTPLFENRLKPMDNNDVNVNRFKVIKGTFSPQPLVKKEISAMHGLDAQSDIKQNFSVKKVPALRLRASNENNLSVASSGDSAFKPVKSEPRDCVEIARDNLNMNALPVIPDYASMWRPW
ncbi:transcription factor HES-4-B-like [Tubulanus polymorphus]|uniref:transcription factor HES-4-B-like n=1 Tax=Tubulanus polymorphus TaxID=672921 RepID=UPI003DA21AAB